MLTPIPRLDNSGDARSSARATSAARSTSAMRALPDLILAAEQQIQFLHETRQPLDLFMDGAQHFGTRFDHAIGERFGVST